MLKNNIMLASFIDHLTVTAPSLDAGAEFVSRILGVQPVPGGEHANKGTHNRLLKLGEQVYLEVIAVNPLAPKPACPYLFGLGHVGPDTPARLSTWVARTTAIEEVSVAASEKLGVVEAMSRNDLHWKIALPGDGELILDGIAPALIEWPADQHPVSRMPESGCRLLMLEAFHPDPQRVQTLMDSIGLRDNFQVHPLASDATPYLVARISSPTGVHELQIADSFSSK